MNQGIVDEFLFTCKRNHLDKITPSNRNSHSKEGYKRIVNIAKEYFKKDEYIEFAGFFQEGQYFIPLWAAHMLLEYGSPSEGLIEASINVIKRYSDNPLAPDVAGEERDWLKNNASKYKEYL